MTSNELLKIVNHSCLDCIYGPRGELVEHCPKCYATVLPQIVRKVIEQVGKPTMLVVAD